MSRTAIGSNDFRAPAASAAYTRVDGVTYAGSNLVDIWQPVATSRPVIILLHGGSFDSGARTDYPYYPRLATRFAEQGFGVANADYTLMPPSDPQVPIDDVLALVQWCRDNAATYNFDASRVGIVGVSAGGHLGLMAGITGVLGTTRPDAVAAWSAAIDFFNSEPTAETTILDYTGAASMDEVELIATYSPLQRLQAEGTCCPIRIVGSDAENESNGGGSRVLPENFDDLHDAAVALGIPAVKRIFVGTRHGFFEGQDEQPAYATLGSSTDGVSTLAANDIPGTCRWLIETLGQAAAASSRTAASGRTASVGRVAV